MKEMLPTMKLVLLNIHSERVILHSAGIILDLVTVQVCYKFQKFSLRSLLMSLKVSL